MTDGLYSDDPKKDSAATFIPAITARALRDMDLNDLVLERVVLDYMERAAHMRRVQSSTG